MPGPPSDAIAARVVHVTDGDTVVLDGIDIGEVHSATGGRSSRLIGIDTPEVYGGVECYGRQASAFTEREIGGADVLVDFDIETTDRYDRALVYLWTTDGVFFNGRLAQQGYALQSTFPPNVRYVDVFGSLVRDAREHNRGLWSACEEENAAQAPAAQAPAAPAPAAPNPGNCDPAYPDFCIPPPPPDLNCADVDGRRFTVHPPDPHNFDGEGDGLGCES